MISIIELCNAPQFLYEAKTLLIKYGDYLFNYLKLAAGKERFFEELKTFPNPFYSYPQGSFFLALKDDHLIGCVGIRKIDAESVEMKRMYVDPYFRGSGTGTLLCDSVISWARKSHYMYILLDTNREMPDAVALYCKAGFTEIPPYCINENANAIFMAYNL